jgi:hypothetical protein
MKTFKFEIQNLISVEIEAETKEEARIKIIDNLEKGEYNSDLCSDCYVSDGDLK